MAILTESEPFTLIQHPIKKERELASPVLKWAGGKTQLLPQLRERYSPKLRKGSLTTYIEPFVGGGAVFFDIVNSFDIQKAYLFDTNPELIILYKVIQQDVESLIKELLKLSNTYLPQDDQRRKELYYEYRNKYNRFDKHIDANGYDSDWSKRAAITVFLNKTCFNGLYRVNSKGEFNVPVGRYKNPKILNANNLRAVSKLFEIAQIEQRDFSQVLKYADHSTFIYYDPPYRPISKTSNFNSYHSLDFDDSEQRRLRDVFVKTDQAGAHQMLSNSDPTNYVDDLFFDDLYQGFKIERVSASRRINSKGNSRGEIRELLVTNY
ncbi:MAG: DNA adenine methylase [Moorea sp. SIO3B2]|uniref:DNA adenine methylase n=1 Tax=Moorena sp. SIO4E2 TaxID=2607826 RepID=UPI0013B8F098|nr:DNA adenine methylase [Moorena sp. SIO4E2]NEP31917.1 DNA adenine methylase [Moorena sp. SIO3B2]NEQ11262.1 DNA adenine methylase [Moorena sp. SIO4E2]